MQYLETMKPLRVFLTYVGIVLLPSHLWPQPLSLSSNFPIHTIGHDMEEEFNKNGKGRLLRPPNLSYGEAGWVSIQEVYEGAFSESKANGYGIFTATIYFVTDDVSEVSETYIGNFVDGYPDGLGTAHFHRSSYHGEFKKGSYNGYGTYYSSDGYVYSGFFVNGTLNGYGTIANSFNETKISGMFQNGELHGQVITTYPDYTIKISNAVNGECSGKEIFISNDGKTCEKPCDISNQSCFE